MAQEDLIPMSERTKEEQKIISTKGGIASGIARREKKAMKEQLNLLLSLPLKNPSTIKKLKGMGMNEEEIDNQMAMLLGVFNKALKGNVRAAEFIRDTTDGKPLEKVEHSGSTIPVVIVDDMEEDDG